MKKTRFFLFSCGVCALFYLLARENMDKAYAIFALPCALLFLKWMDLSFFQGINKWETMSQDRIDLNLQAAQLCYLKVEKKLNFKKKIFYLFLIFITTIASSRFIFQSAQFVYEQLKFPTAHLVIEYPAYSEKSFEEIELPSLKDFSKSRVIPLETSSYIRLKLENVKNKAQWKLTLQQQGVPSSHSKIVSIQIPSSGVWSLSTFELYKQFETDEKKKETLLQLTLSQGDKGFSTQLRIRLTPTPLVTLTQVATRQKDGFLVDSSDKLGFAVFSHSSVPLSQVELVVRTKSGYRFVKTLAEFANASETEFSNPYVELLTLGIPFQPQEDILFVKAVSKTILPGVEGQSKELSFPVQNPLQIREKVVEALKKALSQLRTMKKATLEEKKDVTDSLAQALQHLDILNQNGSMQKNVLEGMNAVENIQKKNDKAYQQAEDKISSVLEMLERQQKKEESENFIDRIQNFKSNLLQEKDLKQSSVFVNQAEQLEKTVHEVKKNILSLASEEQNILTKQERELVQGLVHKDVTEEKLAQTKTSLNQGQLHGAQANAQLAAGSALTNLGSALQILQIATNRALQQAKEQLNAAANALQNSSQESDKKQMVKDMENAQKSLEQTPNLGGAFQRALDAAKQATKQGRKFAQEGKSNAQRLSTQNAQDAVEKALQALEEDEKNDKESQKKQDARAFQSSMDVLAVQGELDSGWRKKILQEISRLKEQGEESDSALIRYLESRLR